MIVNTNSTTYHLLDPIYGLVSKLRSLLLSNMYSKDIIIIELIECIRSIMDPMSIDFDISNYSFCISNEEDGNCWNVKYAVIYGSKLYYRYICIFHK